MLLSKAYLWSALDFKNTRMSSRLFRRLTWYGLILIALWNYFVTSPTKPIVPEAVQAVPSVKDSSTIREPSRTSSESRPLALLHTSLGDIVFTLLPEAAPLTVENFIRLSLTGFYNGTSFYRAEPGFCLQGGGWGRKDGYPTKTIKLEYNPNFPNHIRYVSMARLADPDTASTEFSIMMGDNAKWLGPGGSDPHGYAVFAHVTRGWDVVQAIMALPTSKQGLTYLQEPRPEIRFIGIVVR